MTLPPDGLPPNPNPRKPAFSLPAGACDSHCHIYGPFARFPLPADRSFNPHEVPETALRAVHDRLGFARAVIVQSQGHGFDHGPVLAALRDHPGRYRAVALIRRTDSEETIAAFDAAGFCGVRFSFLPHLGGEPDLDLVREVIAKVKPFGWHVAIHVAGHDIVRHAPFIRSIDATVVVDHMARPPVAEGADGPATTMLRSLIDKGNIWAKISGADRLSKEGPPYRDAISIAASLVRHAPERIVWGSDWPHVNLHGPMPDDGELVDLLAQVVPDEAVRHRILVDNPKELFGFP
ncbi:amidohydrolase family protein [Bosea thiooxidans]